MKTAFAFLSFAVLLVTASCSTVPPSRDLNEQAALAQAIECARGYAALQVGAVASPTEIADVAVTTCRSKILQVGDAVVAGLHRRSFYEIDATRAGAVIAATGRAHAEAVRVVVEGRNPPTPTFVGVGRDR
jgi:hypothetical protein